MLNRVSYTLLGWAEILLATHFSILYFLKTFSERMTPFYRDIHELKTEQIIVNLKDFIKSVAIDITLSL